MISAAFLSLALEPLIVALQSFHFPGQRLVHRGLDPLLRREPPNHHGGKTAGASPTASNCKAPRA